MYMYYEGFIFKSCSSLSQLSAQHYENMAMKYTEIFKVVKMKIFSRKKKIFLFLLDT